MTLPNLLTLLRIALVPIFCYFVFDSHSPSKLIKTHPDALIVAGIIFIIASCTDWFDGYLARKLNQVTNISKLLDPLADKLLVTAALIALIEWNWVPSWTVVIILSREVIITSLRAFLVESGGKVMASGRLGKVKTFTQMAAIILFLFDFDIFIASFVYYIALVLTVVSGLDYLWKSRKYINFN